MQILILSLLLACASSDSDPVPTPVAVPMTHDGMAAEMPTDLGVSGSEEATEPEPINERVACPGGAMSTEVMDSLLPQILDEDEVRDRFDDYHMSRDSGRRVEATFTYEGRYWVVYYVEPYVTPEVSMPGMTSLWVRDNRPFTIVREPDADQMLSRSDPGERWDADTMTDYANTGCVNSCLGHNNFTYEVERRLRWNDGDRENEGREHHLHWQELYGRGVTGVINIMRGTAN